MLSRREFDELNSRIRSRFYEFLDGGLEEAGQRLKKQSNRTEADNLIDLIACNLATIMLAGIVNGVPDTSKNRLGFFHSYINDVMELMASNYDPEDGLVDQLREIPAKITIEHLKARSELSAKLTLLLFTIV